MYANMKLGQGCSEALPIAFQTVYAVAIRGLALERRIPEGIVANDKPCASEPGHRRFD